LDFRDSFEKKKKAQIYNFIKIRLVGAELFHADGQTDRKTDGQMDMTKLRVAFRNFLRTRLKTAAFVVNG
jgi:hypothetical protein